MFNLMEGNCFVQIQMTIQLVTGNVYKPSELEIMDTLSVLLIMQ